MAELPDFWKMLINLFLCFMGLGIHLAMKWEEARRHAVGLKPGLVAYIRSVPAQTMLSVLTSVSAFTFFWAMGWIDPGSSLAAGYMGNSMAENIANKYKNLQ